MPEDDKDRVQQAADIVAVIEEHVPLQRRGREFVGLCPFHDDRKPSMYVSPEKQIFKCFACGAGGDAFSFVMRHLGMDFVESMKHLAEKFGVTLQPRGGRRGHGDDGASAPGGGGGDDGLSARKRLMRANEHALSFYRTLYQHAEHGRVARSYVESRGIHPDMVERFQLGYAPDRWDGLAQLVGSRGWPTAPFFRVGLIRPRGDDRPDDAIDPRSVRASDCYDRLRHRLIFPILDRMGRPIAFGGRVLPDGSEAGKSEAKYLNSPESDLFDKSSTLYGIHAADAAIRKSRVAVVVEGYTDVIACHQAGFENVIATLGTALTRGHVDALRRVCDKVVLVFDADEAGDRAAERAVEHFITGGVDVAIATLRGHDEGEKGPDPADLMAEEDGPDRWQRAIDSAEDALGYQFRLLRRRLQSADGVTARQRLTEEYLGLLARMGLHDMPPARRGPVMQRVAEVLKIPQAEVDREIARRRPRARAARPAPDHGDPIPHDADATELFDADHTPRDPATEAAERLIIAALLEDNGLFHATLGDGRSLDEAVQPIEFVNAPLRRLYEWVYDALAGGQTIDAKGLIARLSERRDFASADTLTHAVAELERQQLDAGLRADAVADAAERILRRRESEDYRTRRAELSEKLASGQIDGTLGAEIEGVLERLAKPSPTRIARLPR